VKRLGHRRPKVGIPEILFFFCPNMSMSAMRRASPLFNRFRDLLCTIMLPAGFLRARSIQTGTSLRAAMLCCRPNGSLHLEGSCCFIRQGKAVPEESLLDPEDEGITILCTVGCSHSATQPQIPGEINTVTIVKNSSLIGLWYTVHYRNGV
jgi:hypothetical protein